MVKDYGVMMTGIRATVIGEIQSEIILAGMQEVEKHFPDIVEQKVICAKDAILEPSNSCGDQSNQICDLFLGNSESKKYSKKTI